MSGREGATAMDVQEGTRGTSAIDPREVLKRFVVENDSTGSHKSLGGAQKAAFSWERVSRRNSSSSMPSPKNDADAIESLLADDATLIESRGVSRRREQVPFRIG